MKPRERVLAVLAGEQPDTVPIVPVIDGYFAPKVIRRRNDECFMDGVCIADALAACLQKFGHDGAVVEMGLGPEPNVLGCPVEIEGHDVPLVVDTVVHGREDLKKIKLPDPWSGGKMDPVRRLVELAGGEHFIIGSVRSPFEYAATVRGLVEFMTDFYSDPDFVRDLIAAMLPVTLTVAAALKEAGVDAVVLKDSFASSSMISPDHYREFAFPAEREAIAAIGADTPVILHICRNSTPIIGEMAATGAAVLEIDSPVDLAEARRLAKSNVVLKGNIDAMTTIEKGSIEDVEEAVMTAMRAAKEGSRFILSTGDSVPLDAPEENVAALVEFGRKYGRY